MWGIKTQLEKPPRSRPDHRRRTTSPDPRHSTRLANMKLTAAFSLLAAALPYALAQSQEWGQCGGIGWTGATTCVSGTVCTVINAYYSQCLPGSVSIVSKPLRRCASFTHRAHRFVIARPHLLLRQRRPPQRHPPPLAPPLPLALDSTPSPKPLARSTSVPLLTTASSPMQRTPPSLTARPSSGRSPLGTA